MDAPQFRDDDDQVVTAPAPAAGAMRLHLTHLSVAGIAPGVRRSIVWDTALKGFGVRVETGGRKSFIVRYRANGGGRRGVMRQMVLGTVGALSCAAARRRAETLLAEARLGGDPMQARKEERIAPTVSELLNFYLDDYARSAGLRASTRRDARGVFELYVRPRWRTVRVADVSVAQVRALHGGILEKAGPHQANRALAYLSSAFTRAVENGWRNDNPFRQVKKSPQDPRTRILSEHEAGRLLQALDRHPDPQAANAIRLLLFTGARLNEVLKAPWSQFDLAQGLWTKPSAHTKQKKMHRLMLSMEGLSVLRAMRAAAPEAIWLFPGRNGAGPRADLKRPWEWVRRAARIPDMRIHDLRRTLGSYLAMDGHSSAVVAATLGHTQASTTARYMNIAQEAQRQALAQASRKLAALGEQQTLLSFSEA